MNTTGKGSVFSFISFFLIVSFSLATAQIFGQSGCILYPNMKQRKVPNLSIPGSPAYKGYLEYLPADYYSTGKKYPLIIPFHGMGESGNGTASDLCKLLGESEWGSNPYFGMIPPKIERNEIPGAVTDQYGQSFSYIIISPQLQYFGSPTELDGFLDYLIAHYRIDPRRIYLTGLSAGANLVSGYVASSLARAKRIAAINPIAACGGLSAQGAKNIVDGKTSFWGVQCTGDNTCSPSSTVTWVALMANLINSQSPPPSPFAWHTSFPVPGYACHPIYNHDAWSRTYDAAFRQVINGRNVNLYEWFIQYTQPSANTVVPVKLKNFTVSLINGKVHMRWTTTSELNTSFFTIERAQSDQTFSVVGTVKAVGNSNTDHSYEWIDDKPFANLIYYRLSETDADGKKQYFEIKRILNKLSKLRIIVSPNPFVDKLSIFINVDRTQKVIVSLVDLTGRKIKDATKIYEEGNSEINIKTTELAKGIYILKIDGEDFSEVQKIIKQ